MKVLSIIGEKKMREEVAPKIIRSLEEDGYTVGFIKKTDNISSNSQTKRAVIWGEKQSLFYHEEKSNLLDLLELFNEDYVIVDNDEISNIPKLLMYQEPDLDNTADINELGNMHNLKRREDVFFIAEKETDFDDIMDAVHEKVFKILPDFDPDCCDECGMSCRELNNEIIKGKATREDCTIGTEDVELYIGDEKLKIVPFVKNILRNSVDGIAKELDGYKEKATLDLIVRKKK